MDIAKVEKIGINLQTMWICRYKLDQGKSRIVADAKVPNVVVLLIKRRRQVCLY